MHMLLRGAAFYGKRLSAPVDIRLPLQLGAATTHRPRRIEGRGMDADPGRSGTVRFNLRSRFIGYRRNRPRCIVMQAIAAQSGGIIRNDMLCQRLMYRTVLSIQPLLIEVPHDQENSRFVPPAHHVSA